MERTATISTVSESDGNKCSPGGRQGCRRPEARSRQQEAVSRDARNRTATRGLCGVDGVVLPLYLGYGVTWNFSA